jgi:hypothetical protein
VLGRIKTLEHDELFMNEEELNTAIFAGEFEPKRLHLSDGRAVDIPRPGSIAIGKRTSGVVIDGRIHTIANLHITRIEPIPTAASA